MRLITLRIDVGLVQPVDGDVLVGLTPIPAGYRIKAINLMSATAKTGSDTIYAYLGVSRPDGTFFTRLDDMSHVNELLSEKIVSTLPIDVVSDGHLVPACYILQSGVSHGYNLYFTLLCEVMG